MGLNFNFTSFQFMDNDTNFQMYIEQVTLLPQAASGNSSAGGNTSMNSTNTSSSGQMSGDLPQCIIYHLNDSATNIRTCNFLNPDIFLNGTKLLELNKDLIY